jgi:hypothetical protein
MCTCKNNNKTKTQITGDYNQQTLTIMSELQGVIKLTPEQTTRLFSLHNYYHPTTPEYGKHCSPCVQRVYKRMLVIHSKILNNEI